MVVVVSSPFRSVLGLTADNGAVEEEVAELVVVDATAEVSVEGSENPGRVQVGIVVVVDDGVVAFPK